MDNISTSGDRIGRELKQTNKIIGNLCKIWRKNRRKVIDKCVKLW